jgi:hypothetical protein
VPEQRRRCGTAHTLLRRAYTTSCQCSERVRAGRSYACGPVGTAIETENRGSHRLQSGCPCGRKRSAGGASH